MIAFKNDILKVEVETYFDHKDELEISVWETRTRWSTGESEIVEHVFRNVPYSITTKQADRDRLYSKELKEKGLLIMDWQKTYVDLANAQSSESTGEWTLNDMISWNVPRAALLHMEQRYPEKIKDTEIIRSPAISNQ